MFLTLKEQLRRERQKNERLTAELVQAKADVMYLSMMTAVEIPKGEELNAQSEI